MVVMVSRSMHQPMPMPPLVQCFAVESTRPGPHPYRGWRLQCAVRPEAVHAGAGHVAVLQAQAARAAVLHQLPALAALQVRQALGQVLHHLGAWWGDVG